jgi:hypothetical protein
MSASPFHFERRRTTIIEPSGRYSTWRIHRPKTASPEAPKGPYGIRTYRQIGRFWCPRYHRGMHRVSPLDADERRSVGIRTGSDAAPTSPSTLTLRPARIGQRVRRGECARQGVSQPAAPCVSGLPDLAVRRRCRPRRLAALAGAGRHTPRGLASDRFRIVERLATSAEAYARSNGVPFKVNRPDSQATLCPRSGCLCDDPVRPAAA